MEGHLCTAAFVCQRVVLGDPGKDETGNFCQRLISLSHIRIRNRSLCSAKTKWLCFVQNFEFWRFYSQKYYSFFLLLLLPKSQQGLVIRKRQWLCHASDLYLSGLISLALHLWVPLRCGMAPLQTGPPSSSPPPQPRQNRIAVKAWIHLLLLLWALEEVP